MKIYDIVNVIWNNDGVLSRLLVPLSLLYAEVSRKRREHYLKVPPSKIDIPIIVVGNITVGGTGKTPMVIWLVDWLCAQGWRPGVVSRGYGGRHTDGKPRRVEVGDDPAEVGDEPVVMARHTQVPIIVGRDREAAVQTLLRTTDCNIAISDDGLQHYRLWRDIEIAMLDGARRLGNGRCLPAGPLREPADRLDTVDYVVITEGNPGPGEYALRLFMRDAQRVHDPREGARPLSTFVGEVVHAVAGIGNPDRFFRALEHAGLDIICHPFPDHHQFTPHDLEFTDGGHVIMTEKDAVKCQTFASEKVWCVPIDAKPDPAWIDAFSEHLRRVSNGQKIA